MATTGAIDPRRLLPIGPRGWLIRTPGFTSEEVRQLLREGGKGERGRAVSRCVARASDWLPPTPDIQFCPPHYRDRLPRIVYWYGQGDSVEAISRRICGFGTPWGVERALDTACQRIAACLNHRPDDYGARP